MAQIKRFIFIFAIFCYRSCICIYIVVFSFKHKTKDIFFPIQSNIKYNRTYFLPFPSIYFGTNEPLYLGTCKDHKNSPTFYDTRTVFFFTLIVFFCSRIVFFTLIDYTMYVRERKRSQGMVVR